MTLTLEQLFPQHRPEGEAVATALDSHAVVQALSLACAEHPLVLLRMMYPATDAVTHRSRDELADVLHRHGLHQVAGLIEEESPYLMFTSATHAFLTLVEIRRYSAAIAVHLYYRGLAGSDAEERLRTDAKVPADGHFKPFD
ncbi:hypothetical protein ACPWR0_16500 [Pandoraea pneumonica]|uniref:Uncharacterized protein n=1 Tax=Pandoraea pneumonica TaxID=2508299 RepID=A0A5E4X333_9BURK|nr:hypothetical protein [Pandoraea pneumonica]VVE30652.1 hypothetical protein PPN31114_03643 [Pandoraea pneumonica]